VVKKPLTYRIAVFTFHGLFRHSFQEAAKPAPLAEPSLEK
jgi:hypothetical protein